MSAISKRIVVASGYFNPFHVGHVEYLEKSKEVGGENSMLVVIVNNDEQVKLKKGKVLISAKDRIKVVKALRCVDLVVESVDQDRSVCKTLAALHPDIFTNGGDQSNECIPEANICNNLGIQMVDGLGAKIESSTDIVKRAKEMP